MTETLTHGYSSEGTQRELSNEYPHHRVKMILIIFGILMYWTKVAPALEGFNRRCDLASIVEQCLHYFILL